MKIASSRILAAASALVVTACAESSSPGQPSGSLSVTVALSVLACHPHPNSPCSISVEAVVVNDNGRPLSYAWSGCGSGTARNTTCTVASPGEVTVAVEVRDDRGRTGSATGTATGTNLPPTITISDSVLWESWNATAGGGSFEVVARVSDPEHLSNSSCSGEVRPGTVVAAGICDKGYGRCFGDMEVGALKTAAAGMCVLTLTGADEWGLTSTTTKTFSLPHK